MVAPGALQRPDPYGSAGAVCVTTTITTYPTSAGAYYAVNPGQITSTEVEGGAGAPTPDSSTAFFALNLGTQIPPNGTPVVVHGIGGRFVFRYDG